MADRFSEYMRLDALVPADINAKAHATALIADSISRFGVVEPIVLDERTSQIVSGHGRREELLAKQEAGEQPPDGVKVDSDGAWLVHVERGWASRDNTEAAAAGIALNRIGEVGGWQDDVLTDLLASMAAQAVDLGGEPFRGLGFGQIDLDTLLATRERDGMALTPIGVTRRDPRLKLVDLIFTSNCMVNPANREIVSQTHQVHCCLAIRSGWRYGTRSAHNNSACGACATWKMHKPIFVDNDYHDYDHAWHREVVAYWQPKYATVRDVMSPEQCEEAGVAYYPLGQILEWADDLREAGAANVMLIPKIDIVDQIPERFMLGYSVPSSYGATPLPTSVFRGRKVHLLGGSAVMQLRYWQAMPDDVVSVDNNNLFNVARFGRVFGANAEQGGLEDYNLPAGGLTNPLYTALAISFGHIASWYGKDPIAEAQLADPTGVEPDDDERR